MSTSETTLETVAARPRRADSLRNHEKLITAGREAFTEGGTATSLEDIARRAGVGIGTLYRHFPSRQALLEAVYVDEVQALCRSAADLSDLPPWEALVAWVHRFVGYLATKQALAEDLLSYFDRDADLFRECRVALFASLEPLLSRAQEAGEVRADAGAGDVIQLIGGIAKIPSLAPEQIDHILDIALDGLRYRSPGA
jgi:AcrR family transcriptional regulator